MIANIEYGVGRGDLTSLFGINLENLTGTCVTILRVPRTLFIPVLTSLGMCDMVAVLYVYLCLHGNS